MNYQVIIIIGLPGSGKTTYSTTDNKFTDYKLFDDFIGDFWKGEILNSIKCQNKVCLVDPRLCMFDIFERYMDKIKKYVNLNKIKLILFENDPDQCLMNIKNRDKRKGINEAIIRYSKYYNLDNYKELDYEVVQVYSPK